MELDLKWLLGTIGLILGVLITKLVDRWFADADAQDNEVTKLTLAIQSLELRIEFLTEKLSPLPKIQSDLNELHGKVREINARKDS
jgi:hypothetical protein